MSSPANYELYPIVAISENAAECLAGWDEVLDELQRQIASKARHIAIECYPGVLVEKLVESLMHRFSDASVLLSSSAFLEATALQERFETTLTRDPVFAMMSPRSIEDYFSADALSEERKSLDQACGLTFIVGTGAIRLAPNADLLIHAGCTRWEIQRRQRAHLIGNLGMENAEASPSLLYKNAFFLEWRVGDALRHEIYERVDFFLDVDEPEAPRMLAGKQLRDAVEITVKRPFRVVPFFDPGPWGGQWMREHFGLPDGPPNYAWAFDCVPEENSVLLGFGDRTFHLPAQVLVQEQTLALLGESVAHRFGAEFPIRFDFLDTVSGGNLSLQVHPLAAYMREHFGMPYTQDESYYIFDCVGDSHMYLGLRTGTERETFAAALEAAQAGHGPLDVERFINRLPTRKHDHISIPSGTVHCSGRDNVVLEISATPYIFTFKLWDWERVGLDGKPRPIHLKHGLANVQWDRNTEWVEQQILHQVETVNEGDGWREERTGLHAAEFLETRRHWFQTTVSHDTRGTLNVLNLIEGDAAIVESPSGAFPPLQIHYGETFIVPAGIGPFTIRPHREAQQPLATIKAYVRDS